jgi:hypothetical protein
MIKLTWKFLCAMARHQWAKWHGFEILASTGTQSDRFEICAPCDYNDEGQCLKCRCLIISKTVMALEKCPLGLWGRVWVRRNS